MYRGGSWVVLDRRRALNSTLHPAIIWGMVKFVDWVFFNFLWCCPGNPSGLPQALSGFYGPWAECREEAEKMMMKMMKMFNNNYIRWRLKLEEEPENIGAQCLLEVRQKQNEQRNKQRRESYRHPEAQTKVRSRVMLLNHGGARLVAEGGLCRVKGGLPKT